jgi:hypothetical protein
MTAKEKAEELFDKYFKIVDLFDDGNIELYHYIQRSKQCALIAVDEILEELSDTLYYDTNYEWWIQVRTEIESL